MPRRPSPGLAWPAKLLITINFELFFVILTIAAICSLAKTKTKAAMKTQRPAKGNKTKGHKAVKVSVEYPRT